MKIAGHWSILFFLSGPICVAIAFKENEIDSQRGSTHTTVLRSIRVFSKGPDPDSPRYLGPRISKHLHNVIQGGTVGVEFDVKKGMGKFSPFWDKIRKYLPKYGGEKKPDFLPDDRDSEIMNPVGRGLIDPRLRPSAKDDHLEVEWEKV